MSDIKDQYNEEMSMSKTGSHPKHLAIMRAINEIALVSDRLNHLLFKITGSEGDEKSQQIPDDDRITLSYFLNNTANTINLEVKKINETIIHINEELFN